MGKNTEFWTFDKNRFVVWYVDSPSRSGTGQFATETISFADRKNSF